MAGATRVALLGVAHLHVDAYVGNLRTAGADVVGATDHDAVRGSRWAQHHAVPWFDSVEALLGEGVDAAVICSETAHHRRLVEQAAEAGVAVLCEKPLATTEEDSAAIVAACAQAGVPLLTAFPMRFSPPLREVGSLLEAGGLGEVWAAQGTNCGELPMRHRSWFVEPGLSGGGALMDHVVHLADILRWFLGRDPVEVYAVTNRILHGDVVGVETGGLVVLTYDDGTFASIDCSWSRPDDYPRWGGLTLELVGERGVVGIDAFSQHLTIHGGPEGPLGWPSWGSDANQGLIDELLAVVRDGRSPAVTGEDGLAATRVALAAAHSAASGQPVPLVGA
jgi:predicted dehydrogenase